MIHDFLILESLRSTTRWRSFASALPTQWLPWWGITTDQKFPKKKKKKKTNLPWSAARNAVYHVASLVAPCASPLLLLWSVLVAPEIPADPSMTKWLDPTFKTPFPGDLYISTLTGPRLSVNFNLLFSLLKNGRKCLPIQKRGTSRIHQRRKRHGSRPKTSLGFHRKNHTPPCWFAAAASGSPGCTWRFRI